MVNPLGEVHAQVVLDTVARANRRFWYPVSEEMRAHPWHGPVLRQFLARSESRVAQVLLKPQSMTQKIVALIADDSDTDGLAAIRKHMVTADCRLELAAPDSQVSSTHQGILRFDTLLPEALSGLIIADGTWASHKQALSSDEQAVLAGIHLAARPIAAIGRGIVILAATGMCQGCAVSAPRHLRRLVEGAGAQWTSERLAVCGHLFTTGLPESSELAERFVAAVKALPMKSSPNELLRETPPV